MAFASAGDADSEPSSQRMSEEIRVFVPGVWLVDLRDADMVFQVCQKCRTKIDMTTKECKKAGTGCVTIPADEKVVLTVATVADFSGTFRATIREHELLTFTSCSDVAALEALVAEIGLPGLAFRCRADIVLGANKVNVVGEYITPNFEILQAKPSLLAEWDAAERPAASYVYQTGEAGERVVGGMDNVLMCERRRGTRGVRRGIPSE